MSSIGSDKARVWARELPLGKCSAKAVMLAIANYVDENGHCWPSASTLARDTDQTEGNVRRLLKWLENVGVIVRFKRWRTEHGALTYEPNGGRQTSDEIRLCLAIDHTELRARIAALRANGGGEEPPDSDGEDSSNSEISPTKIDTQNPAAAADSLGCAAQGAYAREHTLEESLQERSDPPNPPSGGGHAAIADDESWKRFVSAWHFPITDLPKALIIWQALTPPEREDAITGAKGYRSYIDGEHRAKRNRAVKDAHRWLRDKLWQGYLNAGRSAEAAAERFEAPENSDEWKAWTVFYRCCGQSGIPQFLILQVGGTRATCPRRWPPVGREFDPGSANWETVHEGSGQFAAWLRRLRELPEVRIATRTVLQDGRRVQALVVPSAWPPNRGSTGPPKQPSQQDLDEFANG